MDHSEVNKANEILQKLRETPAKRVESLPFELLNKKTNKTTQLLANSGNDSPMNGHHRWYEYEFLEPVFLCYITVEMENYSAFETFEFKWTLTDGAENSLILTRDTENTYRAKVNQLVKSVSFKPPSKWYPDTKKINRVGLTGFGVNSLEEFVRTISDLDSYKNEIIELVEKEVSRAETAAQHNERLKQSKDALTSACLEAERKITDLNNQIGRLNEERKALLADIGKREAENEAVKDSGRKIQEILAERDAERKALVSEIAEHKQTLRALKDDINMFPTEVSGFVSQAVLNIKSYWRLSWVPIGLLVLVTALLLINAANLTTVVDEQENARIFSILITRLPYVLITTAIIGAAYKLAAMLIREIIRINQQRLNLSKISIIATDTSKASEEGLNELTDTERHELRTRLKMDMLRDHMKEYLSRDFYPTTKSRGRTTNEKPRNERAEDASSSEHETGDE
tara:strand:- start:1930 stop:3303 length:1374 start_codon:yes stop_codon:yes gene_type:complete